MRAQRRTPATNAAGQFVFTDIEPGHYALILKTPLTLQPIKDATTSREIVMDVAAGTSSSWASSPFPCPTRPCLKNEPS